jgi:DNA-directed RNA polymerase specialized sigma subunit
MDINFTAIDEFLEMVKEAMPPKDKEQLKVTQKKEVDLWHNWHTQGRKPEHLKPLYESFKPLLQREANKYRTVEIPKSAINAEMRKHFVHAVSTFDPKNPKKASLSTWIQHNLRKSSRFIKTYQNLGKIPEGQIAKIREFKQAKEHLTNVHGFEPDTRTIADHLKWPHKRVIQMQRELRDDLVASGFPHDPAELLTPKELEAVRILQYDIRLTPEEKLVYEYTFGINGRQKLSPGQISEKTKIHPSKISRIRTKLTGYVKEAVEVL